MTSSPFRRPPLPVRLALVALLASSTALAQTTQPFVPREGQAGKDVVWVPTPPALVEKMLDMAKVTPSDFVMDLGSGDGRNIIAAAKRGARGLGVEFNPDMVTVSRRLALEAGVADRAQFVEGDMYAADISKATVLALFLLPDNLEKLRDKFLALPAGTRIVMNTFGIPNWEVDVSEAINPGECRAWCTSLLYYVPARVAGRWKLPEGELVLDQRIQLLTGQISSPGRAIPVEGRVRGDQISFKGENSQYTGRIDGNVMEGTVGSPPRRWRATRAP